MFEMIKFDNFTLEKECGRVVFAARALHIVDRDALIVKGEMPVQWVRALREKIDFANYDSYCICIHQLQHGFYNRMPNRKGIWNLASLPKGSPKVSMM